MRLAPHTLLYCKGDMEDSSASLLFCLIKKLLVTPDQRGWTIVCIWFTFIVRAIPATQAWIYVQILTFSSRMSFRMWPSQDTLIYRLPSCTESLLLCEPV